MQLYIQYDMQTIFKHALKKCRHVNAVKHAIRQAILPAIRHANNMQTCITKYPKERIFHYTSNKTYTHQHTYLHKP